MAPGRSSHLTKFRVWLSSETHTTHGPKDRTAKHVDSHRDGAQVDYERDGTYEGRDEIEERESTKSCEIQSSDARKDRLVGDSVNDANNPHQRVVMEHQPPSALNNTYDIAMGDATEPTAPQLVNPDLEMVDPEDHVGDAEMRKLEENETMDTEMGCRVVSEDVEMGYQSSSEDVEMADVDTEDVVMRDVSDDLVEVRQHW
ncbi:hypothetical protein SISNIDRAFT_469472 [Sistotremastrum niveocremeum HHB9708]|uniref:Uncharacterized protein n=1 Tax=Sistotremastrum niveocremeum HHB9708 TaxID=1314777 RepID=A0A164PZS7_9AGAM|nr:hypothetical protein SISNIDRAFT_469472 [Sistotremastrum niveocremeum HHB9708]